LKAVGFVPQPTLWLFPALTTAIAVATIGRMTATLIHRKRHTFADGKVMEIVIWEVPEPVAGSTHCYKYRLFYGDHQERTVGYDNERPKGDHRHYGGCEEAYLFTGVEQLLTDFYDDIAQRRNDL